MVLALVRLVLLASSHGYLMYCTHHVILFPPSKIINISAPLNHLIRCSSTLGQLAAEQKNQQPRSPFSSTYFRGAHSSASAPPSLQNLLFFNAAPSSALCNSPHIHNLSRFQIPEVGTAPSFNFIPPKPSPEPLVGSTGTGTAAGRYKSSGRGLFASAVPAGRATCPRSR